MDRDRGLLDSARQQRQVMADGMPRNVARLHSHFTRLSQDQPGLPSWSDNDAVYRLRDAVELIEAAFTEQELDDAPGKRWQSSLRRAGEILEWLSHSEIGLAWQVPTEMLSAATYQLAGYPARSTGLLSQDSSSTTDSRTLRAFLRADFEELFASLVGYWINRPTDTVEVTLSSRALVDDSDEFRKQINHLVMSSTLSAMGVLASEMRWGDEKRAKKAIEKLEAISRFLLHSDDQFSWLLAKLCAAIGTAYLESSLRRQLKEISFEQWGQEPIERYLRLNYHGGKALAWPSQIRGIKKLGTGASFALCTPTGSGKTTVAEIAILQGVFSHSSDSLPLDQAPLVIYLVPTRALATEVEFKLSRVFRQLGPDHPIVVTGLYGGTDWGPTDAWITRSDTPAVLICTYEKAEALIRFMGPAFVRRISLVILDEAHKVQFDGEYTQLVRAENRSLRLEWLGTRLFSIAEHNQGRVVALSAVAQETEELLACWVAGASSSDPVRVSYQSTRQMIGRLVCQNRGFTIKYDLLDRTLLRFDDNTSSQDAPYVPNPFPPHPRASLWEREEPIEKTKYKQSSFLGEPEVTEGKKPKLPKKRNRMYPYLYWAAMQLAAIRNDRQGAVLVSVTQNPSKYAREFLDLLEHWKDKSPVFFQPPTEAEKEQLWFRCLASCADYFGEKSAEYRLLAQGVIVHHGKMPGLMARLLIELIQERVIYLAIATSTLTAGVNLPFEVVLIPSLRRARSDLSSKELANLVGRAGRPGYGTEGRSLVLITNTWTENQYFKLIAQLESQTDREVGKDENKHLSPLEALLSQLYSMWRKVSNDAGVSVFLRWLEESSLDPQAKDNEDYQALVDPLDTLDHVLLTAVAELESLSSAELSPDEIEVELRKIWARSYAHFALSEEQELEEVSSVGADPLAGRPSSREQELEKMFIGRGKAIVDIYPSREIRRQLYYTSLPPRSGIHLLSLYPQIRDHLKSGEAYADWDRNQQFEYILGAVKLVGEIPRFAPQPRPPEGAEWHEVLHWWLDPGWGLDSGGLVLHSQSHRRPSPEKVPQWYHYVHQSFIYRFNWGLGSFSALALSEIHGEEVFVASIEDWPLTNLPWIVFWLKELVTWGTLDPVVAYLLSIGGRMIATRQEAARRAQDYYDHRTALAASPDGLLNPIDIREWARERLRVDHQRGVHPPRARVRLLKDFENVSQKKFRVLPALEDDRILWLDPAGFLLAESGRPDVWQPDWLHTRDFFLDRASRTVHAVNYL